jgi:hypothetical protein
MLKTEVLLARHSCAQHMHDTRATCRTSYANSARNICHIRYSLVKPRASLRDLATLYGVRS